MSLRPFVAVLAASVVALPARAPAQEAEPPTASVSLLAGVFQFDLSGTGTAPVLAVRAATPVQRNVLLEGGLTLARPDEDFGGRSTWLFPEVQAQLQAPWRRVAPYVGLGGGLGVALRDGDPEVEPTLSGSIGVRAGLGGRVGLHGEARLRGIGSGFEGSAAELAAGVMLRL